MTTTYTAPQSLPPRTLSKAALTSMILGILFCIPLVTSLCAILFAIVGFRATRNAAKSGRGMAIAGLVLGLFGLLIWSGMGAFVATIIVGSSAPRATLHTFANDLAANNIPAAVAECDPASISQDDLEKLHTTVATYGTYSDLTCTNVNLNATPAGTTCTLSGVASFSSGTHSFNAVLIKNAGVWRVAGFHIY